MKLKQSGKVTTKVTFSNINNILILYTYIYELSNYINIQYVCKIFVYQNNEILISETLLTLH